MLNGPPECVQLISRWNISLSAARVLPIHEDSPLLLAPVAAFSFLATALAAPWDLEALKGTVPASRWLKQDQPVHSLLYAGRPTSATTEVFAFCASPATLGTPAPGVKLPGIVLGHGGGGTALCGMGPCSGPSVAMRPSRWIFPVRAPGDPVFDPGCGALIESQSDPKLRVRWRMAAPATGAQRSSIPLAGIAATTGRSTRRPA